MRRDLVEDVRDLERQRPLAAELPGRAGTAASRPRRRRRGASAAGRSRCVERLLERLRGSRSGGRASSGRRPPPRRSRPCSPAGPPRRCSGEDPLATGHRVRPRKGRLGPDSAIASTPPCPTDGSGPARRDAGPFTIRRPLARTSRRVPALSLFLSHIRFGIGFGRGRTGSNGSCVPVSWDDAGHAGDGSDAWTATGKRSTDETRQWR